MLHHLSRALLPAALLTIAFAVPAGPDRQDPGAGKASPLDAQAAVPPLSHSSAFTGYRLYSDQKLTPWRDANDTAGRSGGWRAYARDATREASQAAEPAASAPLPAAPPKDGGPGHADHQMK
jgi:hypothetical protein